MARYSVFFWGDYKFHGPFGHVEGEEMMGWKFKHDEDWEISAPRYRMGG